MDQIYEQPIDPVWNAAVATFQAYGFRVVSDPHDRLGGDLLVRRADGTRIHARVSSVDSSRCRVSIWAEPRNRELAQLILDRIAERFVGSELPVPFLGGAILQGTYPIDWPDAMAAAEQTARTLQFTVTGKVLNDVQGLLDARSPDSTPVRFQLTHDADFPSSTRVTFIAGIRRTAPAAALVSQMKAIFDRDAWIGSP